MGSKHLFELIPGSLKKRIKQDRRKLWDEQQSLSVAKAWSDLSKHSKNPRPSSKTTSPEESTSPLTDGSDSEAAQVKEKDTGSKDSKQQASQKLIKEELQARVDLLKELAEGYDDPGTPAVTPAAAPAATPAATALVTSPFILCCNPAVYPAVDPCCHLCCSPSCHHGCHHRFHSCYPPYSWPRSPSCLLLTPSASLAVSKVVVTLMIVKVGNLEQCASNLCFLQSVALCRACTFISCLPSTSVICIYSLEQWIRVTHKQ